MESYSGPGAPGSPRGPRGITREDLIRHEPDLRATLAQFVRFAGARLHFPSPDGPSGASGADALPEEPVYLAGERRLLIPLPLNGVTPDSGPAPALLVLKGVRLRAPATMTKALGPIVALWLERLRLARQARCDALTGLAQEAVLLAELESLVDKVRACLQPASEGCSEPGLEGFSGRFCLVAGELPQQERLAAALGHSFAEKLYAAAAQALAAALPPRALAGRLGASGFLVVLPDASPAAGRALAETLWDAVSGVRMEHAPSERTARPEAAFGCTAYPRDLRGPEYLADTPEVARLLVAKALRAARAAARRGLGVSAYPEVLARGGAVQTVLPDERVLMDLGAEEDCQLGMRFLVLRGGGTNPDGAAGTAGQIRAELVVTEVRGETSVAEVIARHDQVNGPCPGDPLLLVDEEPEAAEAPGEAEASAGTDPGTGLLPYRAFQARLREARARQPRHALALVRCLNVPLSGDPEDLARAQQAVAKLAGLARKELAGDGSDGDLLAGRWGLPGAAFLLSGLDPAAARQRFDRLVEAARREGLELAVGVAGHPCLDDHPAQSTRNAGLALEHALLLPAPRLAVCDTISLTVHADRLFTRGDVYAAMQEYKRALLLDESNLLAANSLAVCYARTGQPARAAELLSQVLEREPDNVMAAYNLGSAWLKLGDAERAGEAFTKVLELEPGHVFALVRLGRLAEDAGDASKALELYERAAAHEHGARLAARHLARLALSQGRFEAAREHLHEAIVANPRDVESIAALATVYLDEGEDPQIAASLARQCTRLAPESRRAWEVMARALAALGQGEEAARAKARAEVLQAPEDA